MALLVAVLLLTGVAIPALAATSYPLTAQDALGVTRTLPSEPRRIISLVPSITEDLCAIGACDRLVGVDDYSDYPESVRRLPRLGGVYDPNPERILALEPDLVLLSKYGKLAQTLSQAGVTVFVMETERFEHIFDNIETLGLLLDRQAEARALNERLRAEVSRIAASVAGRPRPTVYYEIDETPYSVGPDSFIGTLLEKAGGRNVVPASLGTFPKISPELVIAADPDVILLGDAPYGVTPQKLASRPGWSRLRALREGRVVALTQAQVDVLNRPGPRVVEALRFLVEALHSTGKRAASGP
ncbi:MAG: ABC transporter substrate-binding protein [Limnochordaceae bacterium]|nr:ABC transporter substrate-binding protein [Limnochordaceae bacterium]